MKKTVSILMTLILVLALFAVPVMAETESGDEPAIGLLSFLNLSEEEMLLSARLPAPERDSHRENAKKLL